MVKRIDNVGVGDIAFNVGPMVYQIVELRTKGMIIGWLFGFGAITFCEPYWLEEDWES